MKTILLTLTLLTLSLAGAHAAAPVHDSITKAVTLNWGFTDLPEVDLSTATAATTDPLINGASAGKTVWYKLQALPTGGSPVCYLDIQSTTGAGVVMDYRLGDPMNPLTALYPMTTTPATFTAGATTRFTIALNYDERNTHMIMIAGTGAFKMKVRAPFAANDYPSTATVLTGTRGTISTSNNRATTGTDEPSNLSVKGTVWFKWTPTFSGAAAADTNFSYLFSDNDRDTGSSPAFHDTVMGLYVETSPGVLQYMTYDDNGGYLLNSRIVWTATAGTTYYIEVGTSTAGSDPSPTGLFNLNFYQANTAGEIYFARSGGNIINNARNLGSRNESESEFPFFVARRYAGNVPCTVQVATLPAKSTATAGSDYQAISTTIGFTAPSPLSVSAWEVPLTLSVMNDNTEENYENVVMGLSNPSSGGTVEPYYGQLDIIDDDSPAYTSFQVLTPEVHVKESDSFISVLLQRVGTDGGYVQLGVEATGGTASAQDYIFSPGQSVAPGTSVATVYGSVKNDNVFELDETISLEIHYNNYASVFAKVIIEDDDVFIPTAGRLFGAITYSNSARVALVNASVSATGVISGKLTVLGRAVSFVTKLSDRGLATTLVPLSGRPALGLRFQAKDATGGYRISIDDSLGYFTSSVDVVLLNYSSVLNPCPDAGRYTFAGNFMGGLTTSISTSGTGTVVGRLYDGTPFTFTGYVDGDGSFSGAAALYKGLGFVKLDAYSLPDLPSQPSSATVTSFRPARAGDSTKLGPNYSSTSVTSARYKPAANVLSALPAWAGGAAKATLSGGPLPNMITKALTVSTSSIIAPADAEKLKITVVPSTGAFSGSFVHPTTGKVMPIYGALIQLDGMSGTGSGCFFDGLKTGTIYLAKP